MVHKIESMVMQVQCKKPLVLCITNNVTMDFVANCLLAIGAAPIMSNDERELEELMKLSHAVNINIGTLDSQFIVKAKTAARLAKHYHKPVVFDPVGAGASLLRTETAKELIPFASVIRGNASEIIALCESNEKSLGVESVHTVSEAKNKSVMLALKYQCTVVVSGAEDFVTNGKDQEILPFGSPIMSNITGMGCALTAVIAAFLCVNSNFFETAKLATTYFGQCGEIAAQKTNKSGSFRTMFIDALNEKKYVK